MLETNCTSSRQSIEYIYIYILLWHSKLLCTQVYYIVLKIRTLHSVTGFSVHGLTRLKPSCH